MQNQEGKRKLYYLLLFGLAIRLVLAWLPFEKLIYLTSDDAYYYFSIAKNLVNRGMLSADGITLTNGFHPLWLFVITPIFAFFQASPWTCIHLVLTLSAFFDTAAAFFIFRSLQTLNKSKVGFWAAAFYLVNPYGLLHTMNGLETALNNFFLALLVYLSLKATPEWLKRGWFLLGTVCGLTLLSRTDNIFVVVALFIYLYWRDRRIIEIVKTAMLAAALVLPWMIYNLVTFGGVVQTSGTPYPFIYHQQYLNQYGTYFSFALIWFLSKVAFYEFALNAFHYGNWIISLVLMIFLVFQFKKRTKDFQPLVWTLAGVLFFIGFHILVRWSVRPWYSQAVFILTLPIVALVLEKANSSMVRAGIALSLFFSGYATFSTNFRIADRSVAILYKIKRQLPAGDRVGVFNSGFVQYFTDQKVINLDGLVNNEVLPYYKQKKGLDYFRSKNIRWLVDSKTYLGGIFGPYFGPDAGNSLRIVDAAMVSENLIIAVEVLLSGNSPLSKNEAPFELILQSHKDWAYRKWGKIPLLVRST